MKKRKDNGIMKLYKLLLMLFLIGGLLVGVGCVKKIAGQQTKITAGGCTINAGHGTEVGECNLVYDGKEDTYWGVKDGDSGTGYEVFLKVSSGIDIKRIEIISLASAGGYQNENNPFEVSLFYGGDWHTVYDITNGFHEKRKDIARGNWQKVEQIRIKQTLNPKGNDGEAYLYEINVSNECECFSTVGCCDGCFFRPNTYECRPSNGGCDLAEFCSGASPNCPADKFAAAETICRNSKGNCDLAEFCSGASTECPSDTFVSAGTTCRPTNGSCDLAEICSGASPDCPSDTFVSAGTACGICKECGGLGVCKSIGYPNYRKGEIEDINDKACCDETTDCVYNWLCNDTGGFYNLGGIPYYCNNGEWGGVSELKCDWNNENCGNCIDNLQCRDTQGQCINNLEFVEDHFCENGEWATRTKLIALQLLDIANRTSADNYTLFCDSYKNALNYYQYTILGVPVTQHLSEVNNICVLKLPQQVILGASLNKPINEGRFEDALTGADCSDAVGCAECGDGQFHSCDSFKVWYNNKTQSVIYSNQDITEIQTLSSWDKFLLFLKNPFQTVFDFLLGLFKQEKIGQPGDYEFIKSAKDFSRIYLDRKNVRTIQGITEKVTKPTKGEYLSVTYGMYSDDICSTVNKAYERFKPSQKDLVFCYYNPLERTYYVVSNSSAALSLWPDLTAKLRTRAPPEEEMRYCEVKKDCTSGENAILSLSDAIDAHASKVSFGGFEYRLCCEGYGLDDSCLQKEEIIRLSNETDVHANAPDIDLFQYPICIKSKEISKTVSCESVLYPGGCYPDEVCVISLSDIADAHVSDCKNTQFKARVCCKIV